MLHHIAFLTTILTLISADHSVTIKNSCSFDLYPGVAGSTNTSNNGFLLTSGSTQIVTYPLDSNGLWSGRVWPRTGCVPTEGDPNGLVCETGDCGNKLQCSTYGAGGVTLAEVTHQTAQDWYDISLVDGYSVPMSYGPQDGTGACKQIACSVPPKDFTCPTELQKKNAAGELIECLSACTALGNAEYCCTGAHNVPDTCPASTYSLGFKKQCPDVSSQFEGLVFVAHSPVSRPIVMLMMISQVRSPAVAARNTR